MDVEESSDSEYDGDDENEFKRLSKKYLKK